MIWEPFVLALFLGLVVSAGLYFAYLWPQVEPVEADPEPGSLSEIPSASSSEDASSGP